MKYTSILLFSLLNILLISASFAKGVGLSEQVTTQPFFPTASSVSLKLNNEPSLAHLGNVVVIADLDSDGINQLLKANGQASIAVLGGESSSFELRDDGKSGDDIAGDRRFSFLAFMDLEALEDRALNQASLIGKSIPVYNDAAFVNNRVLTEAFDYTVFNQGGEVVYTSSPLSLPGDVLPGASGAMPDPATLFERRVLMITDPLVVNDPTRTYEGCFNPGNPDGIWTFKHLMTEMANEAVTGITPSAFVEQWLNQWLMEHNNAATNYDTIGVSWRMQYVIDAWFEASGGRRLDLDIAPFRLLAINPRIDLRQPLAGSTFLNAGEARFTFGLAMSEDIFDMSALSNMSQVVVPLGGDEDGNCHLFPMTVIVEYGIQNASCQSVKQWALGWIALNDHPLGSEAYNGALKQLTQQFTERNTAPYKPNRSALNQVRTNENSLGPAGNRWRVREFNILSSSPAFGLLNFVTTKGTPRHSFKDSATFDAFILETPATGVLPPVPLIFNNRYFLGADSNFYSGTGNPNPNLNNSAWLSNNIILNSENIERRHRRSLNTCDGCHVSETGTIFQHIDSKSMPGTPAILSGFLTGIDVVDPEPTVGLVRHFDDLERRAMDILTVANMSCLSIGGIASPTPLSLDDLLKPHTSRVH